MLDLKDNFLPKGLTPLEDLFDSNDVPKNPKWSQLGLILRNVILG